MRSLTDKLLSKTRLLEQSGFDVERALAAAESLWEEDGPFTLDTWYYASGSKTYAPPSVLRAFSKEASPALLQKGWAKRSYGPGAVIFFKVPEGANWSSH